MKRKLAIERMRRRRALLIKRRDMMRERLRALRRRRMLRRINRNRIGVMF